MIPAVMVDAFAALYPGGGIGRYVRDLSVALVQGPDAPPSCFAHPRGLGAAAAEWYPPERRRELPLAWAPLRAALLAGRWVGARWDGFYGRPAVFHSPLGYGPPFAATRLIEHVHDLTSIEHPEWHPAHTRFFYATMIPVAVRSAARVLTHSEFVRRRVVEVFRVPVERTITIPPPLGHAFRPIAAGRAREIVAAKFGLGGEYLLHVGTLEPRKNHVTLIAAFERLRKDGFPGPLVLVGSNGWHIRPILDRLAASPEARHVVRLERVSDDDLVALYGACTACAYPSLEEGFGMPLLESMACGAPCVISDHEALLELAGADACAVPATDADALAESLRALWRDGERRRRLAEAGPPRAAAYRFERWRERIFALYREELAAAGVPAPRTPAAVESGAT